jgi:hypothetical protein
VTTVKRVTVTKDTLSQVIAGMTALVGKQILVGYPESSTDRDGDIEGPITNATLGYIHEHGSPAANIPARPHLVPGVQKAEDKVVAYMEKATVATLSRNPKKADVYLRDAGIVAMNSVRNEIVTGDFVPLSPSTVRQRHKNRQTKSMRQSEKKYLELVAGGMSPEEAQAATGIRPLNNTGQLRNAITYVLRNRR